MARFRFSLGSVLALKESLVEILKFELAALEKRAAEARAVRDRLIADIEQGETALFELIHQGDLDLPAVLQHKGYLEALGGQLEQQESVVAELEAQVADKRGELLEMEQEREVLQELKKRQWHRFLQQLERAEAQLIDESAIAGFNRRFRDGEA